MSTYIFSWSPDHEKHQTLKARKKRFNDLLLVNIYYMETCGQIPLSVWRMARTKSCQTNCVEGKMRVLFANFWQFQLASGLPYI